MTDRTANQQDPSARLLQQDLLTVRLEQARLLVKRTPMSCLIVGAVILYFTALILYAGEYRFAIFWLALTGAMVGLVYIFPKLVVPGGVTFDNLRSYLSGHTLISGLTGLLWSVLAITFIDPASTLHLFVSINIVVSISLGGMMPSAEYRPSFVALATANFVPFTVYWLITMDGPLRLIGIGLILLYGFGLLVSARSELQTRETLAAKRHRELSEELQVQYRAAEKASAEKSRFLAATSHDMSQPLQAQGFFIRALRPLLDRPDQMVLLDKVESAWRSQQDLLRALVETSRLASGAIIPKRTSFGLASILDNLEAEFDETARNRAISLTVKNGAGIVRSDPLLVTRILRNLLSNAIKFTPSGGHVIVDWAPEESGIRVTVSDDGPGLTTAEQKQIFEEYVQLKPVAHDTPTGLGLGLTIVRQLAAKLDIPLTFESEPGQGTHASILLPGGDPDHTSDLVPITQSKLPGTPLILLIEDETSIREGLAMLLTGWGCRVIAAASGKDAKNLMKWADEIPAVIIADKRLAEDEDGLETALALREDFNAVIPAILLTGDIHHFDRLSEIPDIAVLPKPAAADELFHLLMQSLENATKQASV